jgi:hypothetical protein
MIEGLSLLTDDADIHTFGMQVNPAVILMLLRIESHLVLLWKFDLMFIKNNNEQEHFLNFRTRIISTALS